METRCKADQYRDTANKIREMARRARSEEIRNELMTLAERFERLASHTEKLKVVSLNNTCSGSDDFPQSCYRLSSFPLFASPPKQTACEWAME
jgi:hypothetical protein